MSAKIKIYDLFNYKSLIYILGIQLLNIFSYYENQIMNNPTNIQLINLTLKDGYIHT